MPTAVPTDPTRRREYQPALDGVRALAVAMVLVFHGGFAWMTGGYVGVSVFFTLSGFLITGLLLDEHDDRSTVSIRGFYVRRVRRLMPASLACLLAVSVAAAFGEFGGLDHVRRDVLAALFQVANWNALATGTSYADLMARAAGRMGPVDHFWSLSVEEQFYWVWPFVAAAVLARVHTLRRLRMVTVGAAVMAVGLAPLIARVWGANAAYWATPARLGEILVGAALAVMAKGRVWRGRAWPWIGLGGLAVIVWAAVTWPAGSGPAYAGWLGVFALASAALIAGLQVAGPLRSAFGLAPLAHLGRISYGVYLYHWPIFAILTPERVGATGWGLFAVRIAATLAVAEVSFYVLEQPLRRGVARPRTVAWRTAAAVGVVAVAVLALVPAPAPAFTLDPDVPTAFSSSTTGPTPASSPVVAPARTTVPPSVTATTPQGADTTQPAPARPVSVLLLGDSTAGALADGMYPWTQAHPGALQMASLAHPACGFVRAGMWGDDGSLKGPCEAVFASELPRLLHDTVPDTVVLLVTAADVLPRVWDDGEGRVDGDDDRYVARRLADYRALAAELVAAGVRRVLWVVPPPPSERWTGAMRTPISDRVWRDYVGLIERMPAESPDHIEVVRWDEWMAAHEPADGSWRPEGLHLTPAAAEQVTDEFFAPLLTGAR